MEEFRCVTIDSGLVNWDEISKAQPCLKFSCDREIILYVYRIRIIRGRFTIVMFVTRRIVGNQATKLEWIFATTRPVTNFVRHI